MKQVQIIKPGTKIDFLGPKRKFALLSGSLVTASLIILLVRSFVADGALNYGIDFRGGTQIQIDFQNRPGLDGAAVDKAMTELGYKRVSVINVAGETNAYVIRMENPDMVGAAKAGLKKSEKAAAKAGDAKAVLERRFTRTIFQVVLPAKNGAKPQEVLEAAIKAGAKKARLAAPPVGAKLPTVRVMAAKAYSAKEAQPIAKALGEAVKGKATFETTKILRRFKPSRAGDQVRLIFSENVTEQEIREAFAEAHVSLAPTAGAVARRGRQSRHKIKWQVRLLGLADLLTRQLNDKLKRFVGKAGVRQNLQFALDIPVDTESLRKALRRAGFKAGQPFTLHVALEHAENRAPKDLRKELVEAGLKLATGSTLERDKRNPKRWAADLAMSKVPNVDDMKDALAKLKIKLLRLALRITEARYVAAVKSAGYGADDSIALSVTFKMDQAVNAKQLKEAIEAAKLPIAKNREAIAQVGREKDYRWLVVLDVKGKASIIEIERKLIGKVGARGITAIDIPPHGAVKSIQSVVRVGSKVGKKLRDDGIWSVIYTLGFILLYIGLRFDLKYAPGAVIALAHDVMITTGIWAISGLEFNLATIAALLTIVGYSLNDTIVVFDRIRENVSRLRDTNFEKVINTSLNETLSRTVLTSFTTLISIMPILFLASGDLWSFALALSIGVVVGTYSSIYIASPVVLWLDDYLKKRQGATRVARGDGDKGGGSRGRHGYQKRESKKDKSEAGKEAEARS